MLRKIAQKGDLVADQILTDLQNLLTQRMTERRDNNG